MKPSKTSRRLRAVLGLTLLAIFCQACQTLQNEFWVY